MAALTVRDRRGLEGQNDGKRERQEKIKKERDREGVRMWEIEERGGIEDEGTRKRSHKANRVLNDSCCFTLLPRHEDRLTGPVLFTGKL